MAEVTRSACGARPAPGRQPTPRRTSSPAVPRWLAIALAALAALGLLNRPGTGSLRAQDPPAGPVTPPPLTPPELAPPAAVAPAPVASQPAPTTPQPAPPALVAPAPQAAQPSPTTSQPAPPVPVAATGTGSAPRPSQAPPPAPGVLPPGAGLPSSRASASPASPSVIAPQAPTLDSLVTVQTVARRQLKIDPRTPLKELLPAAPRSAGKAGTLLPEDLDQVPEVVFQEPPPRDLPAPKAAEATALTIARINHLNQKKTDGFLRALLGRRTDLAGLPFSRGEAARLGNERSRQLNLALTTLRQMRQQQGGSIAVRQVTVQEKLPSGEVRTGLVTQQVAVPQPGPVGQDGADGFWEAYQKACVQEDRAARRCDREHQEYVTRARIAALMQVLAPESPALRKGLVQYLSTVPHVEATRALARLALFSSEEEVRQAAIEALKIRRERDYTDVLLGGLRYPWPAVARRAAEALIKLERTDVVSQLVAVLEEEDPRLPVRKEVGKKQVQVVRELVRINHHRSCLMCHAPGNTPDVPPGGVTAQVPVPGAPLPEPSVGYQNSDPDLLVRIDVTYLRQDFSVRLPVAGAHPWPERQRFDFLVRTREVSEKEAQAYRERVANRPAGSLSPYHRAALLALRELTGRDTEPTAQAWRRLLDLPAPGRRTTAAR